MQHNRTRLIQSAVAYGAASLITVTLHEFGHGLTALLGFGLHPTVYGLHEEDIASSHTAVGIIVAAGPVISLVFGLILLAVHKRQRGQGFGRYLSMWLGLLGIGVFFGYLMTAPFYHGGDVYRVLNLLGIASPFFTILSLLVGALGIVQLSRIALPCLLTLTNRDEPLRPQMLALGLLTWLLGAGAVMLAMIPAFPFPLILIGTFAPLTNFFASKRDQTKPYGEPGATPTVSIVGIILLIALAVLEQTVLRHGVRL